MLPLPLSPRPGILVAAFPVAITLVTQSRFDRAEYENRRARRLLESFNGLHEEWLEGLLLEALKSVR